MKKIAIVDADLIGRKKHRFPNLACMKISGFYKNRGGYETHLLTEYRDLDQYEKVYISKVFTDTPIDEEIIKLKNVECGGTGFFFDKAPNLPEVIEHCFPDYHLYDEWVEKCITSGIKRNEFKEYLDYSIGFLTRGCFRKCGFCVNKKYDHVFTHSPLEEFFDPARKKICLLDDNFLGCPEWKTMLQQLIDTKKQFKFKQGLDERLLTDEKCEILFNSKYDGQITFAFDNINDYQLIEKKLKMIRKHTNKQCTFYVLCGFDPEGKYDEKFWIKDIIDTMERIKLLGFYGCIPYIMRFEKYNQSRWRGIYITIARWCNQVSFFKKETLYEYVTITDWNSGGKSSSRYIEDFYKEYPEVFEKYFKSKMFYSCKEE